MEDNTTTIESGAVGNEITNAKDDDETLDLVREKEHVLLVFNDGRRVFAQALRRSRGKAAPPLKVNKRSYSTARLIGQPYGSVLEIDPSSKGSKGLVILPPGEGMFPMEVEAKADQVQSTDNRHLSDGNDAQVLTQQDLVAMKFSGEKKGTEIVKALVQNSSTFDKKTEFSRAKYLERKQKKHVPRCRLVRTSPGSISTAMFLKDARRMRNLREDTLAQMLSYANVHAGMRCLVWDEHGAASSTEESGGGLFLGGIVVGAVARRMGGRGRILAIYTGQQPRCREAVVEKFNLTYAENQSLKWIHTGHLFGGANSSPAGGDEDSSVAQWRALKRQRDEERRKRERQERKRQKERWSLSTKRKRTDNQVGDGGGDSDDVVKDVSANCDHPMTDKDEETKEIETAASAMSNSDVVHTAATATNGTGTSNLTSTTNSTTNTTTITDWEAHDRDRLQWPCPLAPHTLRYLQQMKSDNHRLDFLDKRQRRFARKLTRETTLEKARYLSDKVDSLILNCSPPYDPCEVLNRMLPILADSGPFVVYCPYLEPLVKTFRSLQTNKGTALNLRLTDTWRREYQVLDGRTHPHMAMGEPGGYLLSGIKLNAVFGWVDEYKHDKDNAEDEDVADGDLATNGDGDNTHVSNEKCGGRDDTNYTKQENQVTTSAQPTTVSTS